MKHAFCLVVVLLAAAALEVQSLVCRQNYCSTVVCDTNIECNSNQILKPHSSFCGCCSYCVTQLGEGDSCSLLGSFGYPSGYECGNNLQCNYTLGYCAKIAE